MTTGGDDPRSHGLDSAVAKLADRWVKAGGSRHDFLDMVTAGFGTLNNCWLDAVRSGAVGQQKFREAVPHYGNAVLEYNTIDDDGKPLGAASVRVLRSCEGGDDGEGWALRGCVRAAAGRSGGEGGAPCW